MCFSCERCGPWVLVFQYLVFKIENKKVFFICVSQVSDVGHGPLVFLTFAFILIFFKLKIKKFFISKSHQLTLMYIMYSIRVWLHCHGVFGSSLCRIFRRSASFCSGLWDMIQNITFSPNFWILFQPWKS